MKITICILTWNRPKFLEQCIDDILHKIFYKQDAEILIMDDGSADETEALLKKYANNHLIKIIKRRKHAGISCYKKLFRKAKGEYIIEIDDDVLEFPRHFDKTMVEYMQAYPDYGFLALNVIQNEFTNGAKPEDSHYMEDMRDGKVIQKGPTGGWCACFRKSDYRKVSLRFNLIRLNFKKGEDGTLSALFERHLNLKSGVIKNHTCFHASGPHYAKQYGYLKRDIEKYESNQLTSMSELYVSFLEK